MQVADGVFQFHVPMPTRADIPSGGLRHTLVYAVKIPDGWMVIDAGLNTDEGFNAFQGYLSEAGIAPQEVKLIVITHGHADHAGLANRFKDLTGAKLAIHRLDASGDGHHHGHGNGQDRSATERWLLRNGVPAAEMQEPPRTRATPESHAAGRHWRQDPLNVDVMLEGGEELVPDTGLYSIWTPGHSPGHVCIHDSRRRLLFSGDHVLPEITPHVSLYPGDEGNPLGRFLQAHEDLKQLDVEMVHPAHQHSFPDLRKRVDEIFAHHRERMDEMLAQVQDGPKTSWQIASTIKWNVAPWAQLNGWTRRAALMETMSHLQHMVIEGELAREETDSVALYARG